MPGSGARAGELVSARSAEAGVVVSIASGMGLVTDVPGSVTLNSGVFVSAGTTGRLPGLVSWPQAGTLPANHKLKTTVTIAGNSRHGPGLASESNCAGEFMERNQ